MEIECNTCKHYDPMDGICRITGEYQHGYDDCHALDKDENLLWQPEKDTRRYCRIDALREERMDDKNKPKKP